MRSASILSAGDVATTCACCGVCEVCDASSTCAPAAGEATGVDFCLAIFFWLWWLGSDGGGQIHSKINLLGAMPMITHLYL